MEIKDNEARVEPSEMERLLAEESDYQSPQKGDIRKGIILSINPDQVIVDVGLKREGIVPAYDLSKLTSDLRDNLSVGDEVFVSIEKPTDREGDMIVSIYKAWLEEDWRVAQEYFEKGKFWECEVTGYNKGGLIVLFGNLRAFIPTSQLPGQWRGKMSVQDRSEQLEEYVGQKLPVKIIEVDRHRRRLILSARAAEKEWQESQRQQILISIKEGDVKKGTVSSLCDFGAFIDLGGIDGLVHVSELAWHRVRHPKEVLKVGDEVDVCVLRIDQERQRVGLSIKRLLPEPWSDIDQRYEVDQLVEATITNIVDFGAFAMIEDGVEGLIHISELSENIIGHPSEIVQVGDKVSVVILRIDPERRRLGLSLKKAQQEEIDWAPAAEK